MDKLVKKWWFWIIVLIIIGMIINVFSKNNSNSSTNKVSYNQSLNSFSYSNQIIKNTINSENIVSNATNISNEVSPQVQEENLESKLKKALVNYKFESFNNSDGVVTLTATTTGNAQYSISEDVDYEYIHHLAKIAYKEDNVKNFIFKVTITDSSNPDFNYTYGCSLSKENYLKHDWASILDTDIYKYIIKEGEVYSN